MEAVLAKYGGPAASVASDVLSAEELAATRKHKKKPTAGRLPMVVTVVDLDALPPVATDDDVAPEAPSTQAAVGGRRARLESSSSGTESDADKARAVEVDSDGDVRINRRRRASSSSSSSSAGAAPRAMASGAKAGLKSAEEFAREVLLAKRKQLAAAPLPSQETVYRDKLGRRVHVDDSLAGREVSKAEREAQDAAIRYERNMGAADKLRVKQEAEAFEHAKSLGMNQVDPKLDAELRNRVLEDDPMFAFIKRAPQAQLTATGKPKYTGPPAAPNRFGIAPGFRWDGVDRGSGWEAKLLRRRNERGKP